MFGIGPMELMIVGVLVLGGGVAVLIMVIIPLLASRSTNSTQEHIANLEAENRYLREELEKRK